MRPSICHNNLARLLTFPQGGAATAQLEQNKCGCQAARVLITISFHVEGAQGEGRPVKVVLSREGSGARALGWLPPEPLPPVSIYGLKPDSSPQAELQAARGPSTPGTCGFRQVCHCGCQDRGGEGVPGRESKGVPEAGVLPSARCGEMSPQLPESRGGGGDGCDVP